ncbi:hypothetical protein FJZ40_03290 [Candidatus Shapirobacteria bacterium]|nr:hypothetical protein [Candidatus Shapirobacteria bacterium]
MKINQKPIFIILILLGVFFLRLPSLFEPYWYGDEGIYLTIGQALRKGLLLYRDAYDNKPPILYLLAAASGSVFWFRALLLAWMMGTTFFFYKLAQKLLREEIKARVALLVFALLSSLPLIEGNIANAEIFFLGPIILGLLLSLRAAPRFFPAGVLFSLAFLLKVPAVFDLGGLAVFLFILAFPTLSVLKKSLRSLIKNYLLLSLGFILLPLALLLYFHLNGAAGQFISAAFLQNIGYLSSWSAGTHSGFVTQSGLIKRGVLLLFAVTLLFLSRRRLQPEFNFICLWFVFSLFGATLSERPYPHYLLQVLPPFSLLCASLLAEKKVEKTFSIALFLVLGATIIFYKFYFYHTFSYYQNFLSYAIGRETQETYFGKFDQKVPQTYKVTEFIAETSLPTENIFVWGDEPYIYALSRRLSAGRFTVAYHIVDYHKYQETILALGKNPPRIIIYDRGMQGRSFPELDSFIWQKYQKIKTVGNLEILLRVNQ